MPFDTLTMAAAVDEVGRATSGGRIQRIIQPSSSSVALAIYREAEQWLLVSADARQARLHLASDRLAKAFASPSAFVMLLRKHLQGARISSLTQIPYERVTVVNCRRGDHETQLVVEVMGKHSNVILVDGSGRILGALKTISKRLSRVRPIVPGGAYEPPPAQERDLTLFGPGPRVDPCTHTDTFRATLASAVPESLLRESLLGLLPGASPFLVEQIALRAGLSPTARMEEVDVEAVTAASAQLYTLYMTRAWQPCTFTNRRGRLDVAPYIPVAVSDLRQTGSISIAVEQALGGGESEDAIGPARLAFLAELERRQRTMERKRDSLRRGLEAAQAAEGVMEWGQLALAYQHAIVPGSDRLVVPELGVTVPLDSRLTPSENAERLFRRYRKLRDAQKRLPALLAATDEEIARLEEAGVFARLATSEADLRDLRTGILDPDPSSAPAPQPGRRGRGTKAKSKLKKRRGPARYSLDSYSALVGRSARENEELTFRLARRDDLWLHARERTGAHVVLQSAGSPAPPEVVEQAGQLAAYFSDGRSENRVDVDVTLVRNVRKIPGGAPGRVTYRNFDTLHVRPSRQGWRT
jgi:predicted ribosome quality control (RQC) complex YloA/Tae2 family protein